MFHHVDSDTGEWLSIFDSWICSKILQENLARKALEVGVWKGGWAISQLLNNLNLRVVGIDPFPNLEEIARLLDQNLKHYQVNNRFQLFSSIELSSEFNDEYSFVHIDGEHSEEAVLNDLKFANQVLTLDGVIAVDDIYHPEFPGIASATFNFLHQEDFASFLITQNKIFICRKEKYLQFYSFCMNLLSNHGIPFSRGFEGIQGAIYAQNNSINGFPQLVVRPNSSSLSSFYDLINLTLMEKSQLKVASKIRKKFFKFFA